MTVMIAMLRGVNVLGRNQIKMDVLRTICAGLKFESAQTYVQSGNVVFATPERNLSAVAKRLEDAIEKELGFRPAVVLRTAAEMRQVLARNPFAARDLDGSKFAVTFFAQPLTPETRKQIETSQVGPEEIHAHPRELYIYFPDGIGRSKLPAVIDRLTKKTGTARNWNSVTKMMEMAAAVESGASKL